MIDIHGPTLTVKGQLLPTTEWVRVRDHYCAQDLDNLLIRHNCVNTKIFQDFFWLPVESSYTTVFAPVWLTRWCEFDFGPPVMTDSTVTTDCFNFMIYKNRYLRQLAVEEITKRKLVTNCYVYSGTEIGDIKTKVFKEKQQAVYNNVADYNSSLKDHVFDGSAVALITETIEPGWHNNMTFTEKTLWPMLSLNFPIWLGGYRQAELWNTAGFDTFDDIIDHSYQRLSDPVLRIQTALDSNFKILTDLSYASDVRNKLKNRLKNNQNLVLTNHLKQHLNKALVSIDINNNLLKSL